MASIGLSIDEQKAIDRFRKDVVEPSRDSLVIVDFWAEWCGPCKALSPVLEKVAAEYAAKGVKLVKLDVDAEPFIASQFQVKSIPTVYAVFQGQPVADLTPARSESQLRAALDQILAQLPITGAGEADAEAAKPDIAPLVAMGQEVLADGDGERAAGIFAQLAEMEPAHAGVQAGLVRALLAAGRKGEARIAFKALPQELQDDPAVAQAGKMLELAGDDVDESALLALRAAAAERPDDMEAQYAFAQGAFAVGERDQAAATLLRMIAAEPQWNEGAAKAKLLQIFEAVGLEDKWVTAQRRHLSLLLFG